MFLLPPPTNTHTEISSIVLCEEGDTRYTTKYSKTRKCSHNVYLRVKRQNIGY